MTVAGIAFHATASSRFPSAPVRSVGAPESDDPVSERLCAAIAKVNYGGARAAVSEPLDDHYSRAIGLASTEMQRRSKSNGIVDFVHPERFDFHNERDRLIERAAYATAETAIHCSEGGTLAVDPSGPG